MNRVNARVLGLAVANLDERRDGDAGRFGKVVQVLGAERGELVLNVSRAGDRVVHAAIIPEAVGFATGVGMVGAYAGKMTREKSLPPLWAALCDLAQPRLPRGASVDAVHAAYPVVGRGTVQRIREGAGTKVSSLQKMADHVGVPLSRLVGEGNTKDSAQRNPSWPFERIPPDVWGKMSERARGAVEAAAVAALRDLDATVVLAPARPRQVDWQQLALELARLAPVSRPIPLVVALLIKLAEEHTPLHEVGQRDDVRQLTGRV